MDGREILWELAGVNAEMQRAETKRDAHVASHETPQAVMAELETRTLTNRKELLEFRESNLQMISPIDGIVLAGSLDRRENYPVTKGQVLYEIAPLDQLRVEVGIPADEVMHVSVGDPVNLYFEGAGAETISGTIKKIRPRSEIRDQPKRLYCHRHPQEHRSTIASRNGRDCKNQNRSSSHRVDPVSSHGRKSTNRMVLAQIFESCNLNFGTDASSHDRPTRYR